jgi:hypothetical protein
MAKKSNVVFPVLALGGLAAFAVYLFTGTKLQKLEIAFKAFQKNIKFSFPNLYLPISVEITNPNKKAITLNEINADVYLNGSKSSTIIYTTPAELKARAVSTISNLLIQTEVFTAIDQVMSKAITIRIKGYIRADKMNYPIDQTIQIS